MVRVWEDWRDGVEHCCCGSFSGVWILGFKGVWVGFERVNFGRGKV